MKLTLGFSPCPNDTFIFDALVNGLIDTEGLAFDVVLEDVQTLNRYALEGKLAISKISYGVLPLVLQHYVVLESGGALGHGVGPLLISKPGKVRAGQPMDNVITAIPGENTTAHLLFCLAYPEAKNKQFLIFNEIEDAVLQGRADTGVIIHENRFTYQDKGLEKLVDLGEYWESRLHVPIPLGGIVAKRTLPAVVRKQINRLIRRSVQYAFHRYPVLSDYIRSHSQEMNEEVMRKHINLYVNEHSVALGETGRAAVTKLLDVYRDTRGGPAFPADVFESEETF